MQRAATTVLTILGAQPSGDTGARAAAAALSAGRNVRLVGGEAHAGEPHALGTLGAAVRDAVAGSRATYTLTLFDPLAVLAGAWTATFDGQANHGDLEVAVSATQAAAESGAITLPDYYLAADLDTWPATRRHLYLGVLHELAPQRVIPLPGTPVPAVLSEIGPARWWPPLSRVLQQLASSVPDAAPRRGPRGVGLLDPAGGAHPPASELATSADDVG